uniref:C1q n=1 Tax=Sinonovacula constricta TaxID=98310 RepID=A0A482PGE6_SINCO|nr:C1q [Sinonovacula constricta]
MLTAILVTLVLGLARAQNPVVSFSAGLSHHQAFVADDNVVFDQVFINEGGAYSSTSGLFTCPVSGIYLFQFHALSRESSNAWMELYHNADYIASVFAHAEQDYASAGNSAIIKVTKGDTVYIKAVDATGYPVNLYGATDEVYNTFSGYLLAPVFEEITPVGK